MSGSKLKILLVGDANSIFISNYAKWLKSENPNFNVDILTVASVKENVTDYYDKIIDLTKLEGFAYIDRLKGLRRILLIILYLRILPSIQNYNFIHFHFISPLRYSFISLVKYFTRAKLILSVWGSDMYRLNRLDKTGFLNSCKKADLISFGNPESINFFKANYGWKKNNVMHCRFGLAPLDSLASLGKSKIECKKELGWNVEKYAIAIGYNLSTGQQHLKIIDQLKSPQMLKFSDKIELVFPVSYGGNSSYKQQLLNELLSLPYPFFIYDQYLYDAEIACLRKACDVMIQLQTTDQFSGSMQEHIYAGNVVVTGSWLPYQPMKERGIYFEEVNDIKDLKELLPQIIENYAGFSKKTIQNENLIAEMSLWKNTIHTWTELYN